METSLFDAHFHFDSLTNVEEKGRLALQSHVVGGLAAGVWWNEVERVVQLAKNEPFELMSVGCESENQASATYKIYAAIGMHPYVLHTKWLNKNGEVLEENIKNDFRHFSDVLKTHRNYLFAIGETGFDAAKNILEHENCKFISKIQLLELQRRAFDFCVQQAVLFRLPLIIHSREAWLQTKEAIQFALDAGVKKIMIHCYSGPTEDVPWLVANGVYLSFGGVATWKKAKKVQNSCVACSAEKLLVETDAPDLPPEDENGMRPELNSPELLLPIAKSIAKLRNESFSDLAQRTKINFLDFIK